MSERMGDKRLAEIENMNLSLSELPGFIDEIRQALIAERNYVSELSKRSEEDKRIQMELVRSVEIERAKVSELTAENDRLMLRISENITESSKRFAQLIAAEAKLARVSIVRDECRTAERELIHAADPRGDARIAYAVIACRLDKELQTALSDGEAG